MYRSVSDFDTGTRRILHVGGIALATVTLLVLATGTVACAPSEPVVNETAAPPAEQEATATDSSFPLDGIELDLEPVLDGFEQPLYVTGAGDGSERLFVVEKGGVVWTLRDGARAEVFLDISDRVTTDSERGLLGLAFAPDFADSGVFYVDYTDSTGATIIARLIAEDPASDGPVDPSDMQVLLTVEQPFPNHNAGWIGFGPDGYLYVTLGDGGSGGDPENNGQDTGTLLGTMLRIDVDPQSPGSGYAIPASNPFASGGERPEIWAYGLRNPWRASFDRETGDLWIGDVGQNAWEEIDFQPATSAGGENWGWNLYEGTHPYPEGTTPPDGDFAMPIVEYDHSAGNSVTGGYVYRGADFPELAGVYLYGDFGSGRVWGLRRGAGDVENRLLLETGRQVVSFGEDDAGELYLVDFAGGLYRVVVAR